jgi:hypothetical protein
LLKQFVALPVERDAAANDAEITEYLKRMATNLAKRGDVLEDGKLKVATYISELRGFSREALHFMATEAIRNPPWMPLAGECRALASRYKSPAVALHGQAEAALTHDAQAQLNDALRRMKLGQMTQQEFAGMPDRWKAVAETQGHARTVDGELQVRESTHITGEN